MSAILDAMVGQHVTLREWEQLPLDGDRRLEVVRGTVVMSPRPQFGHQELLLYLGGALTARLGPSLRVAVDVEVELSQVPLSIRCPDLVAVRAEAVSRTTARIPAAAVVLAVEVESPGTVRTDREVKFAEYAAAGIENYWIVDPVTRTGSVYRLQSGEYILSGSLAEPVDVDGHRIAIDPSAMFRD